MLLALALYTSTAHAGIPAGFGGTPGVSPRADSLTEDQRALPKYSQRLPEGISGYFARPGEAGSTPLQDLFYCSPRTRLSLSPAAADALRGQID